MRLSKALADLLEWRWAPAAALACSAIAYVVVAVAFIPDRIDAGAQRTQFATLSVQPRPPATSLYAARVGTTLASSLSVEKQVAPSEDTAVEPAPPPAAPAAPAAQVFRHLAPRALEHIISRRGFSPPLPRAEPEPAPAPVPPPPAAPVPQAEPPVVADAPAVAPTASVAPPDTAPPAPVSPLAEPSAEAPGAPAPTGSARPTEEEGSANTAPAASASAAP